MSDVIASVMFAGVIAYAVFAGADFGVGFWDLTAGGPRKGAPLRYLVDNAIGPVWEANHVWLIFVLVVFWTAFPTGFVTVIQSLAVPFWLAGFGIVVRGAAFVWRKYSPTTRAAQSSGALFATASVVTPFFFGTIAGAVASGRATAGSQPWDSWLNATSIYGGLLATLTCIYLAGVFLSVHADRHDDAILHQYLTRRSLIVGGLTGGTALTGIAVLAYDAPYLFDQLTTRAAPLILASASTGAASLWALWRGRASLARPLAAVATATIVVGWGVAQYPWIIVDETTIADSAAAPIVLTSLAVATGLATLLVIPPLIFLYRLADKPKPGAAPTASQPTESATAEA